MPPPSGPEGAWKNARDAGPDISLKMYKECYIMVEMLENYLDDTQLQTPKNKSNMFLLIEVLSWALGERAADTHTS